MAGSQRVPTTAGGGGALPQRAKPPTPPHQDEVLSGRPGTRPFARTWGSVEDKDGEGSVPLERKGLGSSVTRGVGEETSRDRTACQHPMRTSSWDESPASPGQCEEGRGVGGREPSRLKKQADFWAQLMRPVVPAVTTLKPGVQLLTLWGRAPDPPRPRGSTLQKTRGWSEPLET